MKIGEEDGKVEEEKEIEFSIKKQVCYSCPYVNCTSKFNRPYRLTLHLLAHENKKLFHCTEDGCDKSYTNNSHLIRHVNSKHKIFEIEDTYINRCPQCFKKFANRQNLKRHITKTHTDTQNVCNVCNQQFRRKNMLIAHSYYHTGLKPFSCSTCQKTYYTSYELKRHERYHRVYKCDNCDKTFNNSDLYKIHRKEHIQKEYICDFCQQSFQVRNDIIQHLKKHNVSSVFVCPFGDCSRSYSYKRNLKQHISLIHENKTFDCTICNAKLSTKAKLDFHVVNHFQPKVKPNAKRKRKPRKDKGTYKNSTAFKLSGMVALPDLEAHNTYVGWPISEEEAKPKKVRKFSESGKVRENNKK